MKINSSWENYEKNLETLEEITESESREILGISEIEH